MKTRIITALITLAAGVFAYMMMYVTYLLNKPHIEGLLELGIKPNFQDQILIGFGLFKWWTFFLVAICMVIGYLYPSKKGF